MHSFKTQVEMVAGTRSLAVTQDMGRDGTAPLPCLPTEARKYGLGSQAANTLQIDGSRRFIQGGNILRSSKRLGKGQQGWFFVRS